MQKDVDDLDEGLQTFEKQVELEVQIKTIDGVSKSNSGSDRDDNNQNHD